MNEAKVTPVYKKGRANSPVNYRPISLLSIFSKIFEVVLQKSLVKCLTECDPCVISVSQHSFLSQRSTCSTTVSVYGLIYTNINLDKTVIAVFFIFGLVSHEILIIKLAIIDVQNKA